jgi:N6-L-threonylcarbamoyladenine synthase
MKVLAIETSCDETGIALVEGARTSDGFVFELKKAALLSQALLHSPYGGVYPNLAKREHQKNLPVLSEQFSNEDFDAIAVTTGPGLEPALWTGIVFAEQLAKQLNKPLFAVNHMEGHLLSSLVQNNRLENIQFPVLGLLISGGHTEFVLMRDWFSYQIIGETLDDAVGECFDKVARMLGLPYPGGPEISKIAASHRGSQKLDVKNGLVESEETTRGLFSGQIPAVAKLPRPMINSGTCDFSFSGLKTAALYALRDRGGIQKLSPSDIAAFAAEFEDVVADVLVAKARKALLDTAAYDKHFGAGVAANRYIREQLQKMTLDEFPDVEYRLPQLSITGDNAIMIAEAALCHLLTKDWQDPPKEFKAIGNLSITQKML